jgi:hypothetical protein
MMIGVKFLFVWILSGAAGAPLGMGGEEICSALVGGDVLVPMLALDATAAQRWRPAAEDVARRHGGSVRLVRFVSVEPQDSGVSARDHELAAQVWLTWCNGRNLVETVAAALAQAREEGRAEMRDLDGSDLLG